MPSRKEEQRLAEPQGTANKPRFKIEKLEERIAPRHGGLHRGLGRGFCRHFPELCSSGTGH